jgi:hypothetical protein
LPDSGRAFRRNAPQFAAHLSSLLTRTVTDQPLVCRFHEEEGLVSAFIRFRGRTRRERTATLGNGCQIYVFQRVLPNPKDPRKVTTSESSYSYGVGQNLEDDWLIRYDYVPERAERDPEYKYPIGHVHFNGYSESYEAFEMDDKKPLHKLHFPTRRVSLEDFIEHLIIEMGVPTKRGQEKALELLAESRKRFETEKRTRD